MLQKWFPAFVLALGLSVSANAQFAIGASAGANMTFWEWYIKPLDFDLNYKPALSWRSALVADWSLSPIIGLRAELSYQTWRNKRSIFFTDENGGLDAGGSFFESLHNVGGSLLAKITPFRKKIVYGLVGSSVAHLTAGWNYANRSLRKEYDLNRRNEVDLTNFKRTQYFADFGIGAQVPLGIQSRLFAEARYQLGLSNLADVSTVDAGVNVLGINVGYLYQFGGGR